MGGPERANSDTPDRKYETSVPPPRTDRILTLTGAMPPAVIASDVVSRVVTTVPPTTVTSPPNMVPRPNGVPAGDRNLKRIGYTPSGVPSLHLIGRRRLTVPPAAGTVAD